MPQLLDDYFEQSFDSSIKALQSLMFGIELTPEKQMSLLITLVLSRYKHLKKDMDKQENITLQKHIHAQLKQMRSEMDYIDMALYDGQ